MYWCLYKCITGLHANCHAEIDMELYTVFMEELGTSCDISDFRSMSWSKVYGSLRNCSDTVKVLLFVGTNFRCSGKNDQFVDLFLFPGFENYIIQMKGNFVFIGNPISRFTYPIKPRKLIYHKIPISVVNYVPYRVGIKYQSI